MPIAPEGVTVADIADRGCTANDLMLMRNRRLLEESAPTKAVTPAHLRVASDLDAPVVPDPGTGTPLAILRAEPG